MVIDQVITTYGDPDHHIRGSRSPHKGILITKYGDPTYKENFKDNSKDNFKDKPILTDVSFCGEIISIIGHLNQTLKSKGLPGRYLSTTKNYRSKIIARLKEGYTIEDFEQVHLVMANEWFGTKYQKHLTPDTLYRQSKFPKYINRPTHQQALSPEGHRSFQNLIKACEDE